VLSLCITWPCCSGLRHRCYGEHYIRSPRDDCLYRAVFFFSPNVGAWYHTNLAVRLVEVLLPVLFKPWLGDWLRFYLVVFIPSKKVSQSYSCLSSCHDLFLPHRLLSLRSLSLITMSFRRIRSGVTEDSGLTGSDAALLERTWCLCLLTSRISGVQEESCTPWPLLRLSKRRELLTQRQNVTSQKTRLSTNHIIARRCTN